MTAYNNKTNLNTFPSNYSLFQKTFKRAVFCLNSLKYQIFFEIYENDCVEIATFKSGPKTFQQFQMNIVQNNPPHIDKQI